MDVYEKLLQEGRLRKEMTKVQKLRYNESLDKLRLSHITSSF